MDFTRHFVLLIFLTRCVAVNIKRIAVPPLVESGADSLTLDCEYSVGAITRNSGLVVKWFFNQDNLVYQWIPPLQPQVVGILKDKIDRDFRISEEPLQVHRAIKILRPTTDLTGNYTCVVSTFMEEDRITRSMLVYSPARNFRFVQEKKYVFLVTLICVAENMYPKPEMSILSQNHRPIKQAKTEVSMDSWGLYSVRSSAVVHDDDVTGSSEQFTCLLQIPPAKYQRNLTTVYHSGLMPTAQVAEGEVVEKAQEHRESSGKRMEPCLTLYSACLCYSIHLYGFSVALLW